MTDDELDQIEARLSLQLPPEYRNFAANFPSELPADMRAHEIYEQARSVILQTESMRIQNLEMKWKHSYLVIGDSGCGDWYFLDLGEAPSPVKCWNHDTSAIEYVERSIEKWHERLLHER